MNICDVLNNKTYYDWMRSRHIGLYRGAEIAINAMENLKIGCVITGGTHLGEKRIGKILPYDDDFDFAISDYDFFELNQKLKSLSKDFGIFIARVMNPNTKVETCKHLRFCIPKNRNIQINFDRILDFKTSLVLNEKTKKYGAFYLDETEVELNFAMDVYDLFIHDVIDNQLVYNHYYTRKSIIDLNDYKSRKKVNFGPIQCYSTESGQYLKYGELIDSIPYIIYKPHHLPKTDEWVDVNKYFETANRVLCEDEINCVKSFDFNISKNELK